MRAEWLVSSARFAVRSAELADAQAIAQVQTASWRSSYRGILPDAILDTMDPARRVGSRRQILGDDNALNLVAYDTTYGDVVGFANAGPSRRMGSGTGELYEIYMLDRAKRYGLGRELMERVLEWSRARMDGALIVWVLEGNAHARRFYEAMGGVLAGRTNSTVRGFGVVEVAYRFTF